MNKAKNRKIIVAVSGGFDPIHIGHLELFKEAKALGDKLVVIVNNDHWTKLKNRPLFMPAVERAELIEAFGIVDEVVLSEHGPGTKTYDIAITLDKIRPDIFAQGGDRKGKTDEENAEEKIVASYGGKVVYGIGKSGKIQSSSWLLDKFLKHKLNKK